MGFRESIINRKVFNRFLLSYILVLFVTLFLCFFFYIKFVEIVDADIKESRRTNLMQFKTFISMRLQEIQKLAHQVELNQDLQTALLNLDMSVGQRSWTNKKITTFIESLGGVHNYALEVGIFIPGENILITNSGICYPDFWYKTRIAASGISYESYINLMNKLSQREYVIIPSYSKGNDNQKILYISSLMLKDYKKPDAAVFVLFDFKGMGLSADEDNVFIENSDGEVVFSNRYTIDKEIASAINLQDDLDGTRVTVKGTKYVIAREKSDINNWHYISAIPILEYEQRLDFVRSLAVTCLILSLLISITIAVIFSRNNYRKLLSISGLFGFTPRQGKGIDEFDFIRESVSGLMQEQEHSIETISKQDVIVRNVLLNRLITGKMYEDANLSEAYEKLGLNPEESRFFVMLADTEQFETRLMNAKLTGERYGFIPGIVGYTVQNMIESEFSSKGEVLVTEINNLTACLIILPEAISDMDKFINEFYDTAKTVRDNLVNNTGFEVSVSISRLHKGFSECKKAYTEALDTMEYTKLLGVYNVSRGEEIKTGDLNWNIYYDNCNDQFKKFIILEDYDAARRLLDETVRDYLKMGSISSIQVLRCQMVSFINAFLGALTELKLDIGRDLFQCLDPANSLLNCKSLVETHQKLGQLLSELENYIKAKKKENEGQLAELIVKYIEENLKDYNLSVSGIANHFGVSQVHLSRYFKKEMGMGVLEYTHLLRLEEAKKLMGNNDIPIKEVAENTGFYNDIALIRVFKKYEKTTPGKYRDKIAKR